MRTTFRCISRDGIHITMANALAPLFGRWCSLGITAYCAGDELAITFNLAPAQVSACPYSPFEAQSNGILRIPDGRGADWRIVEQEIVVRPFSGWILELSDVCDGGVAAGRMVGTAVLRRLEAIVETVRQGVRRGIAECVRSRAIQLLHKQFGDVTRRTIRELPGGYDWTSLLDGSNCGEECLKVIIYALKHNPPSSYDVDFGGESGIPTLGNEAISSHFDPVRLADARATRLLKCVCGETTAEEFRTTGRITVESGGYRFVIAPRAFVECTDPSGRHGKLCIHTAGFSCHPIDELIAAYLNIKHRLPEYLRTAIVQAHEPGFSISVV